jgi:threonine/homoserine/homoserine lactone efflux protein
MSGAEITALLLLCTAVSFTPGPNTTLSTALAANFGLRRALRFVFAVPVGWGLLLSLCASGVGALVVSLPPLRLGVKATGVAYLRWLAWKLWHAHQLTRADASQPATTVSASIQALMLRNCSITPCQKVTLSWLASARVSWWACQRFQASQSR